MVHAEEFEGASRRLDATFRSLGVAAAHLFLLAGAAFRYPLYDIVVQTLPVIEALNTGESPLDAEVATVGGVVVESEDVVAERRGNNETR